LKEFLNVGGGITIPSARISAIVELGSRNATCIYQKAKRNEVLIDGTGRKATRTLIVMDTDKVAASNLTPETILSRLKEKDRDI
jgi:regulator of extracellular matrix RemA (YlzA/DUF370 family)